MREAALENKLKRAVEDVGGRCVKFVSPGERGVPDRMCIFPRGVIAFVEMKAPGEKLDPLQARWKKILTGLHFSVWVIDSEEQIKGFMEWIDGV